MNPQSAPQSSQQSNPKKREDILEIPPKFRRANTNRHNAARIEAPPGSPGGSFEPAPPLYYDFIPSPLGPIGMVAHPEGLSFLRWSASESDLLDEIQRDTGFIPQKRPPRLDRWRRLLDRYFSGKKVRFNEPIFWMTGTPLQQRIWKKMSEIPYGEVRSYQWIADHLKLGRAARAVGNACGRNPLPIVIPCHRVVHGDGTLGGYTGGLGIKRGLLAVERVYLTGDRIQNSKKGEVNVRYL